MGSPIIFGLISDEETKKRRYYICSFRRSNIWSEMYSCNCTTRQPYSQNQFVYRMKKKKKKLTLILVFKNLVLLRKLIVPLCLFLTEKILFHPTSSLFGECGSRGGEKFHRSIFLLRLFLAGILLYMETSKILHREINRKNRVTVHLII